jgi:extracellular factor (EF) 3-hydroxypalmitic acid methyl ester biosynthesis protein
MNKALRATVSNTIFFRNSQGITARGILLKLNRNTIVLEVYNPYSIVQLSEVLNELKVLRGEKVIYNGKAVVNNLLNTGLMLIVSATLVDPWKDISDLDDSGKISAEIQHFIEDWETNNQLNPGYQLTVGEIRSFLSDFHRWLEQFDVDDSNRDMQDSFFDLLFPMFTEKLSHLFTRFEEEIKLIPENLVNAHKAYAQSNIHPLILRSPFIHRTFYKPLGYAGDYEMVNMMMRDPREGENLYTQLINAFYLQLSATTAHRNRITLLHDMIRERVGMAAKEDRTFKAYNIACGPALELQRFVTGPPETNCEFDLLDFSQETLDHAKNRITLANRHPDRISFNHVFNSVHTLLKEASSDDINELTNTYDMVYCAGLFDYLSDKVCSRLLKLFYSWVRPGGIVIATNVHADADCRGTMEHIAEWYLVYRDDEQFINLAHGMGTSRIFTEPTGINIFLEISKPDSGQA